MTPPVSWKADMHIDVITSLEWMSGHAVGTTVSAHLALRFIMPSPCPVGMARRRAEAGGKLRAYISLCLA